MQRALLEVVRRRRCLGGAVGCFVVLRGLVVHRRVAGAHRPPRRWSLAYALGVSLLLGAAALAAVTVAIALLARPRPDRRRHGDGRRVRRALPARRDPPRAPVGRRRAASTTSSSATFATTRADLLATAVLGAASRRLVVAGYRPRLATPPSTAPSRRRSATGRGSSTPCCSPSRPTRRRRDARRRQRAQPSRCSSRRPPQRACWSAGSCRCSAWPRLLGALAGVARSSSPTGPAWPPAPGRAVRGGGVRARGGRRDARAVGRSSYPGSDHRPRAAGRT